jgi:hypothetical protein
MDQLEAIRGLVDSTAEEDIAEEDNEPGETKGEIVAE